MKRTRSLGFILPLIAAFALAACGGDGNGGGGDAAGGRTLTKAEADTIARAAMLLLTDLPTAPWVEGELVLDPPPDLPEEDDPFVGTDSCREFQELTTNDENLGGVTELSEAQRSWDIEEGPAQRSIQANVLVFATAAEAKKRFDAVTDIAQAGKLRDCFNDAFTSAFEAAGGKLAKMEVKDDSSIVAGSDGFTANIEIEIQDLKLTGTLRVHAVRRDNAIAAININDFGLADAEATPLNDAVADLIRTADARMQAALGG